jgi:hypothetical protein
LPRAQSPELADQARTFAAEVTELLNGTVTHGVRLSAVIAPLVTTTVHVGRGITRRNLRVEPIPLTLGSKPAPAYLYVAYVLELDPEGTHLAVLKSQYGIYLDLERREMVVHWDYERNPVNEYPVAHIQVNGESDYFSRLTERASSCGLPSPERPLRDFHLPVGGRRYRPTLEDVVEFLIVEHLVDARDGWQNVIGQHRQEWERRQLQAAVRRYPAIAIEQLREDGRL